MKFYLVGGAIRDELLNRKVVERDWVVVGSSIKELIAKGFSPVGKDFPVFLHPETKEEYALARTERKIFKGYKGFEFYTDPSVTLQDDLKRRDFTINALARSSDGKIIDLFGGKQDLQNKILRHISPAFVEDPVRVLRLARFAARYGDFTVAPETLLLCQQIAASGELDSLVPDRIWQELYKALSEDYPWRFFEVLRACNALAIIFPEIDALFGVPSSKEVHPEIDTGIHIMLALKRSVQVTSDAEVRFAVLTHDFGKAMTPVAILPKHTGHAECGVPIVRKFCDRLRVPRSYQSLAQLVTRYHSLAHEVLKLSSAEQLKLLMALDPFRRVKRFEKFLLTCQIDCNGRQGMENVTYPQAKFLREIYQVCKEVRLPENNLLNGEQIKEAIYQLRLQAIKNIGL